MSLTLVILAAGMGSRYGGLKQLDTVGPNGETILDFSIADAMRAGFDRVVFVIRRDIEAAFRTQIGSKYASRLPVDYAFQESSDLPEGSPVVTTRTKPWGTGHAVWCARDLLKGPFAVINADDFYGYESYVQLATFLRSPQDGHPRPRFTNVAFPLKNTLSENGTVARGVCAVRASGLITQITERTGIDRADVGPGRELSGEELVSMNCWGFTPALFASLGRRLREFIATHHADAKAEFYLPSAVSAMIADGEADVVALPTSAHWLGVTYREDKPRVARALSELVARGLYRNSTPTSVCP